MSTANALSKSLPGLPIDRSCNWLFAILLWNSGLARVRSAPTIWRRLAATTCEHAADVLQAAVA
jgi:hypothetical protein